MSKNLGSIPGTKEILMQGGKEVGYVEASMSITSFDGGEKRGPCIQLDLNMDAPIQLEREQVSQLVNELVGWMDNL